MAIRGVVAMAGGQFPLVASCADVAALMVHGDADARVPYAAGRASFDAAPAPRCFRTMFGTGHTLTLGMQPAPTDTHVEPLPRRPDPDPLVTTTTDFFDRYLKSNKTAFDRMRRHGNISGVARLESSSNTGGD